MTEMDSLLKLFDLPDEAKTILSDSGHIAQNPALLAALHAMDEGYKLRLWLALIAQNQQEANASLKGLWAVHNSVMSGEAKAGCRFLADMENRFWKFIALSFAVPIVVAIVIAVLMAAVKSIP